LKSGRGGDGARGGVVHISTELQLMRLRRWRHCRCRKQKYSSGRGRGAAAAVKGAGCCRLGKGNSSIHLIFRGWKAGTSARSTATTTLSDVDDGDGIFFAAFFLFVFLSN
jgi:hypothetical protein